MKKEKEKEDTHERESVRVGVPCDVPRKVLVRHPIRNELEGLKGYI